MPFALTGRAWLVAALAALLVGCAAPRQSPVVLPQDFHSRSNGTIAVAMTEVPTPDTAFPGADCLLCLATASMMNRSLTDAVRQWPTDDLKVLAEEAAALLRASGHTVVVLADPVKLDSLPDRSGAEEGFSRKDFSSLRVRTPMDRLLLIDVRSIGAHRQYSAYIATGPAIARVEGQAYLVDLNTHKFDWFEPFTVGRTAQGSWDEPPRYPGLANAYFTAIEESKDTVKRPLRK